MTEDLFDSYSKPRLNFKPILIGLAALIFLVGAAAAVVWYARPTAPSEDDLLAAEIRDRTILMLEHPTFSGDEFRSQILGRAHLWRYVKVNDEALFWYPQDAGEYDQFIAKCFYDPDKLEQARPNGRQLNVGDYKVPAATVSHFFRTTLENFRIDPSQTLTFPYSMANYTLNLKEMNNFISDSVLYRGKMVAGAHGSSTRPATIFANHGIMVAKGEEPTLKRLSEDLLRDVAPEREARIQKLVDFVSSEIAYSYVEGFGTHETLKRPDETLMTRNGDCSNKTILLASLLEQIGEEYLILYYPHHITIAVPQGNFPAQNDLDFSWNNKKWLIAETTAEGFQVGATKIANKELLQHVDYVQEPQHMQVIFDVNSYEPLDLL